MDATLMHRRAKVRARGRVRRWVTHLGFQAQTADFFDALASNCAGH